MASKSPQAGDTVVANEDHSPILLVVSVPSWEIASGSSGSFTVALPVKPSANVTVRSVVIDGDGNTEVSAGGSLTFTTSNWNTPQTVTITSSKRYDGGWCRVLVSASGADYPGFGQVDLTFLVSLCSGPPPGHG